VVARGRSTQDMAKYRVGYEAEEFVEAGLAATPLAQFDTWFSEAVAANLAEPNAVHLATCASSSPTVRVVLAKSVTADGIRFFTNTESTKGRQLGQNPNVAASFTWIPLHRQIHFVGLAFPLPRDEVTAYFTTRPRAAQVGAHTSRQSRVLPDRADLERRFAAKSREYADPDVKVPVPPDWGGYLIRPTSVEFWQGRPSRLHDRLKFVCEDTAQPPALSTGLGWKVERLSP
jgi:pyridoxamine 5'-phosphate oxidase